MSKLACAGETVRLKAEKQTRLSGDLIGGGGRAKRVHIILSIKRTLTSHAASVKRVSPSEIDC